MGGEKRIYAKVDGGRLNEVKPAEIYKPKDLPKKQELGPLDVISLAADDEPALVVDTGTDNNTARRIRNTGDALMPGSPDALKLEQEIASLRAQYDRQNSKTVVMEAATEKTLILNNSADQTVMYRRQPGGASEHQLPTEKTGIIDMKNDQGFKRASKPVQPPAQPSVWKRFKGLFSKSN